MKKFNFKINSMKIILLLFFVITTASVFAQQQTFDLITYSPPKGWTKNVEETLVSYTITDSKTNSWCRMMIIKSTISKGTIEADFENEWQEIIVKNYNPTETRKENEVQNAEGWKIKAGSSTFTFDNKEAMAMLTTASGYERCVSIVAVTNNEYYLKDVQELIASVDLIKPETTLTQTTVANDDENSIIGTWAISSSNQSNYAINNGINGYIKRQYSFNTNGTYSFYVKSFQYTSDKLLLTKESGTFQINGKKLTVNPKESVIEAWSKKDDTDKWGKLLSSQNRLLEKVTYTFTKHYFAGIQQWNFVLQADKATARDGPFSANTTFNNAWYYAGISFNNPVIELPGRQQLVIQKTSNETQKLKESFQPATDNNNKTFVGSWGKSNSVSQANNRFGTYSYNKQQYTFHKNGTYRFNGKNYSEQHDETLLVKESGTYSIIGNELTINPQISVIEAWSKSNGADNYHKLKTRQKRSLEKVTYQVNIIERKLVLQVAKETERDGRFSTGNTYSYGPPGTFTIIALPQK